MCVSDKRTISKLEKKNSKLGKVFKDQKDVIQSDRENLQT